MMGLWLVIEKTDREPCYECAGTSGFDVFVVAAETTQQALDLVRDTYHLEPYDSPLTLHAFRWRDSKHRKPRLLSWSEAEAGAEGGCEIVPPPRPEPREPKVDSVLTQVIARYGEEMIQNLAAVGTAVLVVGERQTYGLP